MNLPALRQAFLATFGPSKIKPRAVQAPGRVNLIGEHTDYNDGFVLPMALDRVTVILARPRPDALVRIHASATGQTDEFHLDRPISKDAPTWALYPRGVAAALRAQKHIAIGMDAYVAADLPLGSGLSSSASFEVATALALLTVNKTAMDPVELALACQWAEHNYPGMPCGIMDQFTSVLGKKGHALLLDCRDRSFRQVPLNDPDLRVVIANSNVKHELVQGEYTARRHQCQTAVHHLQRHNPQIQSLRDATLDMLEDSRLGLDPAVFRRARHVISENARVLAFAAALTRRDYPAAGQLMYASHQSLRDDYSVSCFELDTLVDIARAVPGVYGARMTGGGFGGCIVALTTAQAVEPLTQTLAHDYLHRTGKTPTTFATTPSLGAKALR